MLCSTTALPLALAALLAAAAPQPQASAGKAPEDRALERALKLLRPPPTVPVRFIDPELAADPQAIRQVDAFLVREAGGGLRPVIYLNLRSPIVVNAVRGREIDIAILAAVVRHEQEHLRGGSENQARVAEREFFQRLIFAGRVPLEEGLAYLHDLARNRRLREG